MIPKYRDNTYMIKIDVEDLLEAKKKYIVGALEYKKNQLIKGKNKRDGVIKT